MLRNNNNKRSSVANNKKSSKIEIEEEEEEEEDNGYLSSVSLSRDNTQLLLNDYNWMPVRLPENILKRNRERRIQISCDLIFEGCSIYKLDYVSEDNIRKCAKEVVEQMYERTKATIAEIREQRQKELEEEEDQQRQQKEEKKKNDDNKIELTADLTKEVTFDYVADIFEKTTIKKDYAPKLITFSGMLLAQTNDDQFNVSYQSESSAGKSYIALETAAHFPDSEIVKIASASPTAFYHSGTWDSEKKELIVDLRHKIIIFLDQPHFMLLEKLRPLLSHDDKELHYMITDKNQKGGLRTKNVVIMGPASFFFCTTKMNPDEQEKTRLIMLSPETDEEKLKETLKLITLKKCNYEEYDKQILQDFDRIWLKKRIMCVRQWGIREIVLPNNGYDCYNRFVNERQHLKSRHQRDYPRVVGLIKAHALLNCFNREKLSSEDTTIMATQTDIDAGFGLYRAIEESNEMGLSPYVLKIYNDVFVPILDPDQGVSREQILKQHFKVRHKSISPEVLRLELLPQLEAVGLIHQEEGERRKIMVYPTVSHTYNQKLHKWETEVENSTTNTTKAVCGDDSGVNPASSAPIPTTPRITTEDQSSVSDIVKRACIDGQGGNDKGWFDILEWKTVIGLLPAQHQLHGDEDQAEQTLQALIEEGKIEEFEKGKYWPTTEKISRSKVT